MTQTPDEDNLPEALQSWLDLLVTEVKKADAIRKTLRNNAATYLRTLEGSIQPDPNIARHFQEARSAIADLINVIEEHGYLARRDDPIIVQTRERALLSLEELKEALFLARPSDRAQSLGPSW